MRTFRAKVKAIYYNDQQHDNDHQPHHDDVVADNDHDKNGKILEFFLSISICSFGGFTIFYDFFFVVASLTFRVFLFTMALRLF